MTPAIGLAMPWATQSPSDIVPIRFGPGSDHDAAIAAGIVGPLAIQEDGRSFTFAVHVPPGTAITVDDLLRVTPEAMVSHYAFEVAAEAQGSDSGVDQVKLRFWTGPFPPTSDEHAAVCAVLDLAAPAGTRSEGSCALESRIQLVASWALAPAGEATFSLRPIVALLHEGPMGV